MEGKKPSTQIKKQIRLHQSFLMEDETCRIEPASHISSVTYFRFSCQTDSEPLLIQFRSNQKRKIEVGKFQLRAIHHIGKKQYLEIETGLVVGETKTQARLNMDDTELDYPSKNKSLLLQKTKQPPTHTNPFKIRIYFILNPYPKIQKEERKFLPILKCFLILLVHWSLSKRTKVFIGIKPFPLSFVSHAFVIQLIV